MSNKLLKQYIKVYTDGGFDWRSNLEKKVKSGVIAYKIENSGVVINKVLADKIDGLKQYSNLMELFASIVALERVDKLLPYSKVILYTDSTVNKNWLTNKSNLKKLSKKHGELKRRALRVISKLQELVVIYVPRDKNLAGIALEKKYKV